MSDMKATMQPLELARWFHEAYERLAPRFGYETREETRAFKPTSPNGRLMTAVCAELLGMAREEAVHVLPDGSAFGTLSFPLPADHWLTAPGDNNRPPMPFRMGREDPRRVAWAAKIKEAGRYAARCATNNGRELDFDPDALLQNLTIGLLGYWTEDGLSKDEWANPEPVPPIYAEPGA